MAYTEIDDPTIYFNTVLYTGNGGTQSITGVGFQPDWIWLKGRSATSDHKINDVIRGTDAYLSSNNSAAEDSTGSGIQSYNSDGFSLGDAQYINDNSVTYASWNWKAGTSFTNDASSTGIGSIDSAGSASDASGFSIVSYTGTGSAGTIKHGLSATANFMIIKNRDAARSWNVYFGDQTKYMYLNDTAAQADAGTIIWNNTAPTSSVFSIGTDNGVNQSGEKYIAYVFAEKQGYSKFGSYTGNGNADGTFCYLGFKPAWVMTKRTDGTAGWHMQDNKRNGFNYQNYRLFANNSDSSTQNSRMDLLSNGFKYRDGDGNYGANIYMAFAENPFVTSTGVPATAR